MSRISFMPVAIAKRTFMGIIVLVVAKFDFRQPLTDLWTQRDNILQVMTGYD